MQLTTSDDELKDVVDLARCDDLDLTSYIEGVQAISFVERSGDEAGSEASSMDWFWAPTTVSTERKEPNVPAVLFGLDVSKSCDAHDGKLDVRNQWTPAPVEGGRLRIMPADEVPAFGAVVVPYTSCTGEPLVYVPHDERLVLIVGSQHATHEQPVVQHAEQAVREMVTGCTSTVGFRAGTDRVRQACSCRRNHERAAARHSNRTHAAPTQ